MNACDCGGSDCTDNELPSDINNGSEPGSATIDLTCNGLSIGRLGGEEGRCPFDRPARNRGSIRSEWADGDREALCSKHCMKPGHRERIKERGG